MSPQEVARRIGWDVEGPCHGGEFGAQYVSKDSARGVMKLHEGASRLDRIANSVELGRRAHRAGQLAPEWISVGVVEDYVFTIQERIDGEVPQRLTLRMAERLLELLEIDRDLAADWDRKDTGFEPWWDPMATLETIGGDVAAIGNEIAAVMVAPPELRKTDVVHDDFHHRNVLTRAGDVVAVVDWDAARVGDLRADAFLLAWWAQVATADFDDGAGAWLRREVDAMLSEHEAAFYAADLALRQLDFFGRAHPEALTWILDGVNRVLRPRWV